jgi:hypothetical protein
VVTVTNLEQLLSPAGLIQVRPLVPARRLVSAMDLVLTNPPLPACRLIPARQLVPALRFRTVRCRRAVMTAAPQQADLIQVNRPGSDIGPGCAKTQERPCARKSKVDQGARRSNSLDVCGCYHFCPSLDFGNEANPEFAGGCWLWVVAEFPELFDDSRLREYVSHSRVQSVQHGYRQARGRNKPLPSSNGISRKTGFRNCWSVRQAEKSTAARHRQCAEPAISHEFGQGCWLIENKIDALTEQLGDGRCTTTERYVLELDVRHVCKKLDGKMLERSNSRRSI